jgi:hypothetical protein
LMTFTLSFTQSLGWAERRSGLPATINFHSTFHSPQPLGWGSPELRMIGNHFNGFPLTAIPSHTA